MVNLVAEKAIYQRFDENTKRVLTDIGINIIENQPLMDLLVEADAVDFDNETSLFIPLKRDYFDHCTESDHITLFRHSSGYMLQIEAYHTIGV